MQRLGENAMWLREDNLSAKNEIVLPYDSDIALWDRPSWIDSLMRLRWCCCPPPPPPPPPKEIKPATRAKKSKKKKKKDKDKDKEQQQQQDMVDRYRQYHNNTRYTDVPPPPPNPQHLQQQHPPHHQHHHYQRYELGDALQGYHFPDLFSQSQYPTTNDGYNHFSQQHLHQHQQQQQQAHDDFFQPQPPHHHQDLLNSMFSHQQQHPQPPPPPCQPESYAISPLSSSGSDYVGADSSAPAATAIVVTPGTTSSTNAQEDRPSRAAAAAAAAAAATLKKQAEKQQQQQQRVSSKNPNRPPLVHRGVSPVPQEAATPAAVTPSPAAGTAGAGAKQKPPLLPQRSRSMSPNARRPASPQSPLTVDRPRLASEGSKLSLGTASTRHRRKVHESFEFSNNSLKQIVDKTGGEHNDKDLPRTSPPAYIECPTHHFADDWSSLNNNNNRFDDDNSMNLSVDEEIGNLIGRIPPTQQQHQNQQQHPNGYISPVDSSDNDRALRARDPNYPALSWMNSWTAQGDAAAGNPNSSHSSGDPRGGGEADNGSIAISNSVRLKNKNSNSSKPLPPAFSKKQNKQQQHELHHGAPPPPPIAVERPVFLPRCKAFDKPIRKAKNRVVISGWAAISLSDKLRNRLVVMEGPLQLKRSDIGYFQLIRFADASKRPIIRIQQSESGAAGEDEMIRHHEIELKDRYEHRFQSQEVCGRAGRCVCLTDVTTRQVLLTILPVSLPKFFFRENRLVDEKYFLAWQTALFTPFTTVPPRLTPPRDPAAGGGWGPEYCVIQYAPDEQYDAATHVLFALDTMLKVKRYNIV